MRRKFYQRRKPFYVRFTAMICVVSVILTAFFVKLTEVQLVNAASYLAQADTSSTRTQTVAATRGEILDRYGRVLVSNRAGYNVVFDAATLPSSGLNGVIARLSELLTRTGDQWTDNLPLTADAPYDFLPDAESDVASLRSHLGLARYATAANCFDAMVSRYRLEGLTETVQRTVMGVRYSMEKADYSIATPFVFAEDVSDRAVTVLKETAFEYEGVELRAATFREYTDPTLAPHILGYVGLMSAEEWERVKESGAYQFNDKIGKAGMEQAAESYLHGTAAKIRVTQDASGVTTESTVVQEMIPGQTVQLTIDRDLQRTAQDALEHAIREINAGGGNAKGGAAVVLEVKTGEILAAANYPSYSLEGFTANYSDLLKADNDPLFDRALNGGYPPGSTFKPLVGIAGLETGKITAGEGITCLHTYRRWSGYQPSCLGYHGWLTVSSALAKSCNYFFFEVGYRVGIRSLNDYCRRFGLGVSTGVELGEFPGVLAGIEEREARGGVWNPGDTVQAAIGQSDNAFTPLQLAVYTATIANGGTRYRAHYLKGVYDYAVTEKIKDDFVEVLDTVAISPDTFNVIREGMLQVTENGTATATFGNYAIKVAGKTGTADSANKTNAMFIAFAPYDDPQIAVAIAVENGGHGSAIAPVAKEILDRYFYQGESSRSDQPVNTLLK